MKILRSRYLSAMDGEIHEFWAKLEVSRRRLLLLDYDGTLAPFRIERNEARPYEFVPPILDEMIHLGVTNVVIISGRAINDLLPLIGLKEKPEIWGSHGWERLEAGHLKRIQPALAEQTSGGMKEAATVAREIGISDERIEIKPVSVAVHWRGLGAEDQRAMADRILSRWEPISLLAGLVVHPFDGGLELRVPGRTKGDVVKELLAGEDAGSAIAYLGDDATDEDAFAALGARGLSILCREEPRETKAEVWLKPPEELRQFLETWLGFDRRHDPMDPLKRISDFS
jgi:trehalose-phosphatase